MSVELVQQNSGSLSEQKVQPEVVAPSDKVVNKHLLQDGTIAELEALLEESKSWTREMDIPIEFHDLTLSAKVSNERVIPTVTTMLSSMLFFWKTTEKKDIDILSHLTGRILPRKMTLIIGPPGSGKSVLLKALSGQLVPLGGAKLSGEVYYDGDNINSGKFIPGKVADYIEQGDTHEAVITVDETFKFAWLTSTGGHHSYATAKDEASAEIMNRDDKDYVLVNNILTILGLRGCKDTYVGNGMVRGISGGQKRRVTVGELMTCPRPIKMMDSISNGLDTATTYDIVRANSALSKYGGTTMAIALLQPPPDVYNLFEEIILMTEGCIIYHGPREQVMSYFADLGYICPPLVDDADFLQELPTLEGKRFRTTSSPPRIAHNAKAFEAAWKSSELYKQLISELRYPTLSDAQALEKSNPKQWPADYNERFVESFWFYFVLCLERQMKIVIRDPAFTVARVVQCLIVGAISGSLFNGIGKNDTSTMNGFLFNTLLFGALGSFAVLPIVYEQKAVFYKQKASLLFPSSAYTFAQTMSLVPLQLLESIIFVAICYWSAGLSSDYNGSRFLTFIVLTFAFSMAMSQAFRVIAVFVGDLRGAIPISGLVIIVMILFSGFIQPKSLISDGWIWFYWMNPVAWALKAVTINEFASPKYDFLHCLNPTCTETQRFGDFTLEQYGNPTNESYIWYSLAVLVGEYLFLLIITALGLEYVHVQVVPAPPLRDSDLEESEKIVSAAAEEKERDVENGEHAPSGVVSQVEDHRFISAEEQLPFDPLSFAFKDIWYTVTLPKGGDIDLLQGVNGYIEPGSVTALMGSSGAGKTTLLDVLAGRKNTGVVKGEMFLNGVPKVEAYFRKIMGYVEQFDTLPQKSTGREAIAFSAALRLPAKITVAQREKWVNAILKMLDLQPLQNVLIGSMTEGGMTFEQRKRVSIGVELAANPSILFLDEPTTGLDSRAALALVRSIRNVAASGRSIVCTIHQPSAAIFNSFDSLLLLRRGGQTVYFGPLGVNCKHLVDYFEQAPGVTPIGHSVNPATWMLEVIGAGTSTVVNTTTDFHAHYNSSALCETNLEHLSTLTIPLVNSRRLTEEDVKDDGSYNATYWQQFTLLMHRIAMMYWRTPTYSLVRHLTNILIALIFASAYPLQKYHTYIATVSRAAVIYITSLFCGILAMLTVTPVIAAERPAFYREQQSRMYSVGVYCTTLVLIELPYLLLASLAFTLPFFYIVGFDNVGNIPEKFMWYWFFNFLLQGTMLFLGEFFVALAPDEATTHVLGGFVNTVLGLFCGFLIAEQDFPPFWTFMYWLNPMHYALEGLFMSQFNGDSTEIRTSDGSIVTAEYYMKHVQFTTWRHGHVGYDVLALSLFIVLSIAGMYLCFQYLRHDKR